MKAYGQIYVLVFKVPQDSSLVKLMYWFFRSVTWVYNGKVSCITTFLPWLCSVVMEAQLKGRHSYAERNMLPLTSSLLFRELEFLF